MENTNTEAVAQTTPITDTITVTTPNGSVVLLKGYVSGGAMEAMKRVFLENVEFQIDEATGKPIQDSRRVIKGTTIVDYDLRAMELFVISFNGSTQNAFQKVCDLPNTDYEIVKAKVEEITGPLAKTPSQT